jgi:hypothetical protein
MTFTFLEGTQPELFCEYHGNDRGIELFRRVELDSIFLGADDFVRNLTMPVIRDELIMREIMAEQSRPQQTTRQTSARPANRNTAPIQLSNPLLNTPQVEQPVLSPTVSLSELPESTERADNRSDDTRINDNELEPPLFNPLLD